MAEVHFTPVVGRRSTNSVWTWPPLPPSESETRVEVELPISRPILATHRLPPLGVGLWLEVRLSVSSSDHLPLPVQSTGIRASECDGPRMSV